MYINTRNLPDGPSPQTTSSSSASIHELSRFHSTGGSSSDGDDVSETTNDCSSPLTVGGSDASAQTPAQEEEIDEEEEYCKPCKPASKARKTCHRCGNIRKNNIACNSCEQIFCKACARKFEDFSGTGFKFNTKKPGCPVCLKLCCCGNAKGSACQSKFHCYRRCEISRKSSKRRAPVKASHHDSHEKKKPRAYNRTPASARNNNYNNNSQQFASQLTPYAPTKMTVEDFDYGIIEDENMSPPHLNFNNITPYLSCIAISLEVDKESMNEEFNQSINILAQEANRLF
jgi:hypothetical protein